MPLVCPQCKQLFEQNGVCPLCKVILLYHAQNLTTETAPSAPVDDEPSQWQQTPWGKIVIGLILAQGLNFGLQQLVTAGFLATGDGSDVWGTLFGIVLHHTVLGASLIVGGALCGAGQSRGMVYGAVVGFTSGLISLALQRPTADSLFSTLVFGEPIIHLATGAIGGGLGMLIWRPTPRLPELEMSGNTPAPLSGMSFSLGSTFTGPIHFGRVCAGAFVVVIGVVWSKAIMEFLLRASNGGLTITSQLQAQLVSLEISALMALIGAGFAGATTKNGLKQGLCVGLAAAALAMGVQINNPKFVLEAAVFNVAGIIIVSLVGGWFGGQLFPPYDPHKRRRRSAYS